MVRVAAADAGAAQGGPHNSPRFPPVVGQLPGYDSGRSIRPPMESSRRHEVLGSLAVGCMAIGTFSTCDK